MITDATKNDLTAIALFCVTMGISFFIYACFTAFIN